MKLAIISKYDSPNTLDLIRAAQRRNVDCKVYALRDLTFDIDTISDHEFFTHDIYLFRGYNQNYILAQTLAQALVKKGKTVIDSQLVGGFIPSKFHEAVVYKNSGIPHMRTYQAGHVDAWQGMGIELEFPVVIKDIDSQRGKGVRLCHDEDQLLVEIKQGGFRVIIQEFVAMAFDIRVICVGDKVVGAIKREASGSDFRTNISLGGQAESYSLNKEESQLALKAHQSIGNEISGVDITYDENGKLYVIETNITPEWQGFKQATGLDVADIIIQYSMEK